MSESAGKFARAMWRQGTRDLAVARRLHVAGDHEWACVAAQQAAEKCLKAVLLHAGLRAEHTHNLRGLFDALVGAGVATREARARLNHALSALIVAFEFSRYPAAELGAAPADIVSPEQAAEAVAHAEAVVAEARRLAGELDG